MLPESSGLWRSPLAAWAVQGLLLLLRFAETSSGAALPQACHAAVQGCAHPVPVLCHTAQYQLGLHILQVGQSAHSFNLQSPAISLSAKHAGLGYPMLSLLKCCICVSPLIPQVLPLLACCTLPGPACQLTVAVCACDSFLTSSLAPSSTAKCVWSVHPARASRWS